MALGNVHLTPQLVQAVRDAVDIVAIASEHTRLRKAGRRYQGLCPIHKEKTPSFSVDPVQGLFYCFGCGAGGDAIKLHMLTTGDDFPAAIEALAMRYGIPLPSRDRGALRRRRAGAGPRGGAPGGGRVLRRPAPQVALRPRSTWRRRGASRPSSIERFGLGYAPEGFQNMLQALAPAHAAVGPRGGRAGRALREAAASPTTASATG